MESETFNQVLPAVAAAIFNESGEILLQKRKDVDKWCIISGHVEFGETVEDAILREIKEETDTLASIVRLIGIYSSPESQTYSYKDRTVHYITSYFEARLSAGIPDNFSNDETVALRYFPTNGLPDDFALVNEHWLSDALDKAGSIFLR